MSTASSVPRTVDLPDHANEPDTRALAIDRVGIKGLRYPIRVLDRDNREQNTVATINAYVGLPQEFKGTHMSRFVEVLNQVRGQMTFRQLPEILRQIQTRLDATDAYIEVELPYFMEKRAPVSGEPSLMDYQCRFEGERRGQENRFLLVAEVPVKSLCPCSKAVSDYGAHNQRSYVTVEVRSSEFIWLEDIIEDVEACASAPLFSLLKRADEKYVTELAYDNPKFVEDLVRDVVVRIRNRPGIEWLRVQAENKESIHNHSAYAEIVWSPEDAEQAPRSDFRRPASTPVEPFGEWLRNQRNERSFNQRSFADALGVSPGFLSRVESDEKRLSTEALARAAEVLSIDPVQLQLRAGVVPPELAQKIAADPAGFLAWVSQP
jgi:GTP cyclohydrolase I